MVRRCSAKLSDVTTLANLCRAFHRAARGKRHHREVQSFEMNLLARLSALGDAIHEGRAPLNRFRRFQIRDPKPRLIHAPVFEDRVVHHALMAFVGPVLDRALIDDSFACRVGRGSLAAVLRAQRHLRRHAWYVKVDIRKYFASIPHDRLIAAVAKKIGRGDLSHVLSRIVRGFEHTPGRGLPIGALTSQYLANFYLAPLDRFLVNDQRVAAVTRYMDDQLVWCARAEVARTVLADVRHFVHDALGLELKRGGFVQRSCAGLSFLGFRIYPGVLKLSRRRQRRYRVARDRWERVYMAGEVDALGLQQGYASAWAMTAHADASGFRRTDLKRHPAPDA